MSAQMGLRGHTKTHNVPTTCHQESAKYQHCKRILDGFNMHYNFEALEWRSVPGTRLGDGGEMKEDMREEMREEMRKEMRKEMREERREKMKENMSEQNKHESRSGGARWWGGGEHL